MKLFLHLALIGLAFHLSDVLHAQATIDPQAVAREIDALLAGDWQKQQLSPNPPVNDETFVRRVYLDIAGRIPTLLEARSFLDSREKDKRAKLIDTLLASDGHAQHFFHFWADILRLQTRANGDQGGMTSKPFVEHVKQRLRENQPYDAFVREMLSAQGKVWDNPAIGYYMRDLGMPLDNLASTSRIFLGTRIECAQCHNHPFDKWTQMQFYQMAAFTYPLETNYTGIEGMEGALNLKRQDEWKRETRIKKGTDAERTAAQQEAQLTRWVGKALDDLGDFVRYSKVKALPKRQLKLPHDYQYSDARPHDLIKPSSMMGRKVEGEVGKDFTMNYAAWITSPENPRFTTVIANRLWKRVFGLGLIEPVDEMLDSTQSSHPALMKRLEQLMIGTGYDMKAYLRVLYNTGAYQREVTRTELTAGETYHFTGPLLRRMSAEQIWDSFVTLIHATPDLPRRRGMDFTVAERIAYRHKLSDALDTLSSEELFDGAMKASHAYETISARAKVLKDDYATAQKAKDKANIQRLANEIRNLEFIARSSVNDHLVVPAVARLYEKMTGKPAPSPQLASAAPSTGDNMTMSTPMKYGQQRQYIPIPGYEMDDSIRRADVAASQARAFIFMQEALRFNIPESERVAYLNARAKHAEEWMRAADLDSPAPRGHYLREFGQSDRDLIENANLEASMPQALVLMNGTLFPQIVQPYTQLRLHLDRASSPEEKFEVVYLTLLSRQPTAAERTAWTEARRSGLDSMEDLIYALLNTQQFLFIR